MYRIRDFVAAERRDHPLDLPPVAEARDIAVVAAALGTDGSFQAGIIAIDLDELGGIGQCHTSMNEWAAHERALSPAAVSRLRTSVVNKPLTMLNNR